MIKHTLFLISTIVSFSFCNNNSINDRINLKCYNYDQNIVLNEIIISFDNYFLDKMGETEIEDSYVKFLINLTKCVSPYEFHEYINELDSVCQIIILKLKKQDIFNDIWNEYPGVDYNGKPVVYFNYNLSGNYLKTIKKELKQDKTFNEYFIALEKVGGYVAGLTPGFPHYYKNADFSDANVRLFTLIHFIMVMNDASSQLPPARADL